MTSILAQAVSTILTLILVLAAMLYLSWQITVAALVMIPVFLIPVRVLARRIQRLSRSMMEQDGEMSALMTERFNVSGAMLAKLYGRPQDEKELFASKAGKVRTLAIRLAVWGRLLPIIVTVLTTFTTALVYGLGGALTIDGAIQFGTLVAMVALLMRLYGPVNELSSMQATATVALVSFDRVFEILDLKPLITERPGAKALPPGAGSGNGSAPSAPDVAFEAVSFRYPSADEVSLLSLELHTSSKADRSGANAPDVLHELSFHAPMRQAHGAGRAVGCRQDHHHPAGAAYVRHDLGHRAHRRSRRPRSEPRVAGRERRGRHPGVAPLPRHPARQPVVRPPRGRRGGADRGVQGRADLGHRQRSARRARHRRG